MERPERSEDERPCVQRPRPQALPAGRERSSLQRRRSRRECARSALACPEGQARSCWSPRRSPRRRRRSRGRRSGCRWPCGAGRGFTWREPRSLRPAVRRRSSRRGWRRRRHARRRSAPRRRPGGCRCAWRGRRPARGSARVGGRGGRGRARRLRQHRGQQARGQPSGGH